MRGRKAWLWTLLAPAVLGLAVGSQVAKGQDNPKGEGEKPVQKEKADKPQGERGDRPVKGGAEFGEYTDWVKDLGLSDEQQAKLREVVKTAQEARDAWYKAQMEMAQKQREEALAILTPAQKDNLAGLVLYRAVLGRYQGMLQSPGSKDKSKGGEADLPPGPLQLTDAQKEKIKAICADAAKEAPAGDDKGKGRGEPPDKVMQGVMQAVRDQVLTAEQKNALAASQLQQWVMGRALAGLGKGNDALKISDEQLAKIKTICVNAAKNLDPKADEKGNAEAFQKVMEEVKGVLTAEQREEVNKRMEPRGGKEGKGGEGKESSGEKGEKPPGDDGGKGK